MESSSRWLGSGRMWVEVLLLVVAVAIAYSAFGLYEAEVEPESPETDGESIAAFAQVAGAALTGAVGLALVAAFELLLLIIRRRRTRARA